MYSTAKLLPISSLLVALIITVGCGRSGSQRAKGVNLEARIQLNVLAGVYMDYLAFHRGKPPKDEAEFREFLETRSVNLEVLKANSLEELLNSPRDGKPFVIVCGKLVPITHSPGDWWIAYEQDGVNGKRMVARSQNGVDVLSPEEFATEFPGG